VSILFLNFSTRNLAWTWIKPHSALLTSVGENINKFYYSLKLKKKNWLHIWITWDQWHRVTKSQLICRLLTFVSIHSNGMEHVCIILLYKHQNKIIPSKRYTFRMHTSAFWQNDAMNTLDRNNPRVTSSHKNQLFPSPITNTLTSAHSKKTQSNKIHILSPALLCPRTGLQLY